MIVVDVNKYRLNQQRLQSVFRADALLWISQSKNWDFSIQKFLSRILIFIQKEKNTVPNIFDIRPVKSSDKSWAWFCHSQIISDIAGTFFIVKGNFLWNIKREVK